MTTQLTTQQLASQDTQDAYYAWRIDQLLSPWEIDVAMYERGKALLAQYDLVSSEDVACNFDAARQELEATNPLVAPAVLQSVGYEHTQERFIWVALIAKEQGKKGDA
jgi:hypothetical protein